MRPVDVGVAEHLAAHRHSSFVSGVAHGHPSRWLAISRLTSAARSTHARCAAGSSTSIRAPGIACGDRLTVLGRDRRVLGARDHERGRGDARQAGAQVEVGDRLAAARVALGRRGGDHRAVARDELGMRLRERRREPASDDGVGDHGRACPPCGRARRARPSSTRRQERGRADQDQLLDPLRRVDREPLADHAADRQPAVGGALELEPVHQREHVAGRGRRSNTDRRAPASRRGRGGRSGSSGSPAASGQLRAPTSRACVPSEPPSSSAGASGGAVALEVKLDGASSACYAPAPGRSALAHASSCSSVEPRSLGGPGGRQQRRGSRASARDRSIRFSSSSRDQAAADPTSPSSSRCTPHSACQAPAARSCSCSIDCEHRRDQARHALACTPAPRPPRPGCACGPSRSSRPARDRRPRWPRRPPAGRAASRRGRSWRTRPRASRGRPPAAAGRTRIACQGSAGSAKPELGCDPARRSPEAGRRPVRPSGPRARDRGSPRAPVGGVEPGQPRGGPQPERDRQRLLQQRPSRPSACAGGRRRARQRPQRPRPASASSGSSARARDQHQRRVDDVLAGGAEMDVRRRAARRPPPAARRRARRPASRAWRSRAPSAAMSKRAATRRGARSPRRASAVISPSAAHAVASAASTSSIACSSASSVSCAAVAPRA